MTEFALILAIQVAALAYALVVGRGVLVSGLNAARLKRLGSALERATASFSARQARALGMAAAALALATFGLHLEFGGSDRLGRIPAGISAALGLVAGAGLCWAAAYAALRLGVGASVQVVVAASRGLDRALSLAMRAGGAASLCAEALSGLGLIAVFGTVFALLGGTTLAPKEAMALSLDVTAVLASFPLGAALAALVCQRSGGLFQTAVDIGGDVASEQRFGLTRDDPRNPTLVGELSGSHLGESATRAALLFVSTATSQVALLALGLAAASRDASPSLALVLLPFVVRAFFVLASAFGCSVVRTEEMTTPSGAIVRGYLSTSVIGLSGLCGASLWLQKEHFWVFLSAGSIGTAASWLLSLPVWARLLRPAGGPREAAEALRVSGGSAAITSLGSALQTALLPLAVLGIAATLSFRLGEQAGFASGGVWTSLVTWAALLGSAPFAFAASAVATIADGAPAVAALAGADSEAQRRSLRLDEMQGVGASARAQLITNLTAAALLSALAVPALAREELRIQVALFEPIVTWSGALGAALILAYAGSSTRRAVRGARELAGEVDRQLRKFPREHGIALIPADFSPSYKACIDLSTRLAFVRLAPEALAALAVPAALALGLRVGYSGGESTHAVEGLMSLVLFAGLVGFTSALAFDLARATLNSACRSARAQAGAEPLLAVAGDGAADLFGHAAGPAAQALLVGTAALALAIAPFMN
ncbi:MAG TPA: sodium/proton-translocating pyrophosphatase [Polyangiaceae bacterium]|nr:sodium/proton-translocating pyrophosphatase [Polyangiaceae bacterium]